MPPPPPHPQCASLAFLAQQCRRRLRSQVSADDPRGAGDAPISISTVRKPSPTTFNPFGGLGNDAGNGAEIDGSDSWQRKLTAWRHGFCAPGGGEGGAAKAKTTRAAASSLPSSSSSSSSSPPAPLALFLRLRTPTEAFHLLAKAEECSPRPLSATVSAAFVSAAEGLYGALSMEAAAAWRDAVCPHPGAGGGGGDGDGDGDGGGATVPGQADIEPILAGLASCWRLQRVSARCASLLGRLLLETSVSMSMSIAEKGTGRAGEAAAAVLAYTRACSWLLASGEPVQNSFSRLKDVAGRVSAIGDEMERTRLSVAPSFVFLSDGDGDDDEDGDDDDDDDDDEDSDSFLTTAGDSSRQLKELLPRVMYESYLLPALSLSRGGVGVGLGDWDSPTGGRAPPISVRDGQPLSFDDMLSGLVSYLHSQDMRQLTQRPGLRGLVDGVRRSTPLSTAVVSASRIPWASCPAALSLALAALDEQDKALAESASSNLSTSSSTSSGTSLSGRKTPPGAPGVAKRSTKAQPQPASKARRGAELSRASSISSLDNHGPVGDGSSLLPAQDIQWVVVARAILLGYSEEVEQQVENAPAGSAAPGRPLILPAASGASILTVHPWLLQLACERHPALVVASSARVGAGPLARDLLNGGKAQPVVAALVNLTSSSSSCGSSEGRMGEFCKFRVGLGSHSCLQYQTRVPERISLTLGYSCTPPTV